MATRKITYLQVSNTGGTTGQVLVANGTAVTWGDANNTAYLGGTAAAGYQTTAGLSANVATLTANNTSFVGSVSAANVVSNAQLSANLANYAALGGATFTGAVVVSNNLTVTGNLTLSGNTLIVGANNLVVSDAVISLHTPANLAPLTSNDGKNIGIAFHYYDTEDRHGLLYRDNSTGYLQYHTDGGDPITNSNPTGNSFGTIQAASFWAGNSSVYATANATNYTGTSNNATNLGGVAAASYVNTAGAYTITGVHTYNANVVIGTTARISANGNYGTANQVLTSNGTGVYWSTVAAGSGTSGTLPVRQQYTGDGTTTEFTVSGGYIANSISVFLNGVMLRNGTEATVTSGSTFTISSAPANGALIDVVGVSTLNSNGVNTIVNQQFTANGSANSFTVTGGYISGGVQVFLNSVKQIPGTDVFITSGNTVNFAVTPANGYIVDVYGFQNPVAITSNVISVGNTSIGTNQISVGNSSVNTQIVAGNVFLNGSTLIVGNTATNTTITGTNATFGSNTLTIGTSVYSVANGNVGIGTNSPGAKLDVVGPSVRLGSQVAGNPFSLELRTFYETCSHTVGAYGGYTISNLAGPMQITGGAGGITIGDGSAYLSVGFSTVSTNCNVDMGMQQLTCGPINSSDNITADLNIEATGSILSLFGSVSAYTTVSDGLGNVRTVPQNSQGSAYTLTSGDAGKYINITTGGVTVATSTALTVGQSVSIYNDSGSNQTITQGSSVTMYLVGTATTGNRTLAQRGLCTIFCVGANTYVITGGGLT
jgi:hypothetical protein